MLTNHALLGFGALVDLARSRQADEREPRLPTGNPEPIPPRPPCNGFCLYDGDLLSADRCHTTAYRRLVVAADGDCREADLGDVDRVITNPLGAPVTEGLAATGRAAPGVPTGRRGSGRLRGDGNPQWRRPPDLDENGMAGTWELIGSIDRSNPRSAPCGTCSGAAVGNSAWSRR
ncbi:hypothetical protein Q5530_11540 [Saccharothrix sp. BKS2]|uniref:hypothetical protein n=1 Tax=Saccharothrix sp. BKS2 TaxID=3064400 RepID=UPI0039EB0D2F